MGRRYGRSVSSLHLNFGSSILAGFLVGLINKECSMSANRYILDEKVGFPAQSLVQDRQVMVRGSLMRKSNKYLSTIL